MLGDVTNVAPDGTKQFQRRKPQQKAQQQLAPGSPPATPCSPDSRRASRASERGSIDAASTPSTSSSSSTCDAFDPAAATDACSTLDAATWAHSTARKARRSSMLPYETVFQHNGPSYKGGAEQPGTRLQWMRGLSRAKQRAYVEYMRHMVQVFAEVDAFDLAEEEAGAEEPASPSTGSPGSIGPLNSAGRSSVGAGTPAQQSAEVAASPPAAASSCLSADTPPTMRRAAATPAAAAAAAAEAPTEAAAQEQEPEHSSALAASPAPSCPTPAASVEHVPATTCSQHSTRSQRTAVGSAWQQHRQEQQQQQQQQDKEEDKEEVEQEDVEACMPGSSPQAASPSVSRHSSQTAAHELHPEVPASPTAEAAAAADQVSPYSSPCSSSSMQVRRSSLEAATPALQPTASLLASPGTIKGRPSGAASAGGPASGRSSSAAVVTPAADMGPTAEDVTAGLDQLLVANTPASAGLRKALQQQQQQQRESASKSDTPSASRLSSDTAAHLDLQPSEQQQQQEEEEVPAEQHQQTSLEVCEEDAASAALQEEPALPELSPLQRLLLLCDQEPNVRSIPSMAALLKQVVPRLQQVVKIGEGSYGEAFKLQGVVVKLVPIEGTIPYNDGVQKTAPELEAEALIALTLNQLREQQPLSRAAAAEEVTSNGGDDSCSSSSGAAGVAGAYASVTTAFVETYRVGVCRGPVPPSLLRAWDAFDARKGSENDPLAGLPPSQLYFMFAMADGGRDLEAYQVAGYDQARSALLQVTLALAVAEEGLAFEHRDLHWGNVLLAPATSRTTCFTLQGREVEVQTHGALVTLIDFTASRLQLMNGGVAFCDLEADPTLFEGPKDSCQANTYRRMRAVTKGRWQDSAPRTNLQWLHYLADIMLTEKALPGVKPAQKKALREFRARALKYDSSADALWDDLFKGLWSIRGP